MSEPGETEYGQSAYWERDPPESLRPFVQCLWRYRTSEPEPVHMIVPDGRPEFIVHRADPYREFGAHAPQPAALFAGQLTRPLTLVSERAADMIGVRFRPDGARAFLGGPVDAATDVRLALIDVHGPAVDALVNAVRAAPSDASACALITDYVQDRIGTAEPDPIVRPIVDAVITGDDAAVEEPDGVTQRQFQRRFRRETGVSLRMLRTIRRFRAVFDRLRDHEHEAWVERAMATGYFDQAQMARDFQRFLGCSARDWLRTSRGLGKALGAGDP